MKNFTLGFEEKICINMNQDALQRSIVTQTSIWKVLKHTAQCVEQYFPLARNLILQEFD